jgi:Isochorismatase family
MPLNAGRCVFEGRHLNVVTDSGSGSYSAFVPVSFSGPHDEPAVFICDLDVQEGAVGLSAVTAYCSIISERIITAIGRRQIEIAVPRRKDIAGILVRNLSVNGRSSRLVINKIVGETYSAKKILYIRQDRPSRTLRLPLRKQSDGPLQELGDSITTLVDIDVRASATIVIDAWRNLATRVAPNVSDKLAPTLTALRSTGMAILHAAHDREIHPLVRPLPAETEILGEFHDTDVVSGALSDAGIRHLIYLGYFSNMCIVQRSVGMLEMHKRGFDTILVRDASVAKETKESIAGEWFHKAAVHFVELNFGASTTAAEIQVAAAAISSASDQGGGKITR